MAYAKVRSDFEFLESLSELSDQVELDSERLYLMQEPTKAKAAELYEAAIELWFSEHGSTFDSVRRVNSIKSRYYI